MFLDPPARKTNSAGQASVNLTSGTKARAVQIIAEVTVDSRIIRSKLVNVSIHGGLPDINHFTVAAEYSNLPGLAHYGFVDNITAYIGDKYADPVKPNTSA